MINKGTWMEKWEQQVENARDFARLFSQNITEEQDVTKATRMRHSLSELSRMIGLTSHSVEEAISPQGNTDHFVWAHERSKAIATECMLIARRYDIWTDPIKKVHNYYGGQK